VENRFSNLQKDQYIKMDFRPIKEILDQANGDREEN
jgi:hypothetical protein